MSPQPSPLAIRPGPKLAWATWPRPISCSHKDLTDRPAIVGRAVAITSGSPATLATRRQHPVKMRDGTESARGVYTADRVEPNHCPTAWDPRPAETRLGRWPSLVRTSSPPPSYPPSAPCQPMVAGVSKRRTSSVASCPDLHSPIFIVWQAAPHFPVLGRTLLADTGVDHRLTLHRPPEFPAVDLSPDRTGYGWLTYRYKERNRCPYSVVGRQIKPSGQTNSRKTHWEAVKSSKYR